MRMLGTLCWMLLLGNSLLLPLVAARATTAHVCDTDKAPFGTYVCDPTSRGTKYFICLGGAWPHQHLACPEGLLFDVKHKACSWARDVQTCDGGGGGGDTVSPDNPTTPTPTPTPTTTTTPSPQPTATQPTSLHTITTTTTLTTDTTKDTPVTINTSSSSSTTRASSTTTTTTTTNPCIGMPDNTHMCDPATSGTSFLVCWKGRALQKLCPPGTFFNQRMVRCDWEREIQVMCVAGQTPAVKPTTTTTSAGTGATTTAAPVPKGDCNPKTCKLPSCRCVGTDIPGEIPRQKVPQMVLVTFDDRIGLDNYRYYPELFWDRAGGALKNPNNCTTGATFFVSNDGNVMDHVKTVWKKGHEIASHSLTHSNPSSDWTADHWAREMQGMRVQLATAVGASVSEIRGLRTPYLALGGETQFSMMQHNGFIYDSSFIAGSLTPPTSPTSNTTLWPFTLHHPPTVPQQACIQANCPKRSYPGIWEVPLIRQYSLDGRPCAMTDACPFPESASPADVSKFLRENFLRHYRGHRAPFMISLHATWFRNVKSSLQGLKDFLAEINANPDVWQVTVSQMLDWVRHPVPMERLGELASWKACSPAV